MRTTLDECEALGREIGRKLSAAHGQVSVLFPSLGVSAIDCDGKPFDNWAARMALWEGLRSACSPDTELRLLQNHINDPTFAEAAAHKLLQLIHQTDTASIDRD